MKPYLVLLFLLYATIDGSAQTPSELGVAALGIVVSDIESSEGFYKDILGMTEVNQFDLDEQWSQEAGVADGQPFSVKMLKLKNSPSATIIKLAYFAETETTIQSPTINQQAGVNYLTLHYEQLAFNETVKRIEKAKLKKLGWVKRETYQLFFIRDPDGLFIEIVGPPG